MKRATTTTLALFGFMLLVIGIITLMRQVGGTSPIEWVMPCVLLLGGGALLGGALFFAAGAVSQECSPVEAPNDLDPDLDPDV